MRRGRPPYDGILTPREWAVAELLPEGLTYEEIALRLGISFGGVKYHVAQIFSKLGVNSREEAVQALAVARRGSERRPGFAATAGGLFGARASIVALAVLLAFVVIGYGLLLRGAEPGDAPPPGPELIAPDVQVDLPAITVTLDERYDPSELPNLLALLQRSYESDCEPDCRPQSRAGVSLIRPADGSVAADVRIAAWGILAVKRPAHGQLLIATGYGAESTLLALDARDGFSLARVYPLPDRTSHRVFLGTDFILSNDERYLYFRTVLREKMPGCSPLHEDYYCLDVLDLETGTLRRVAMEDGCANPVLPYGGDGAIVTCPKNVFRVGSDGAVIEQETFVYYEQPHTGTLSSPSNYYGWVMEDGRLAVLSSQGVLSYRERDGEVVHRPLLPPWLQLYGLGPPFDLGDGRVLFGVTSVPVAEHYDPALGKAAIFDPRTRSMTLVFDFGEASYVAPVPDSGDLAVLRYDGAIDIVTPDGSVTRIRQPGHSDGGSDLVLVK